MSGRRGGFGKAEGGGAVLNLLRAVYGNSKGGSPFTVPLEGYTLQRFI